MMLYFMRLLSRAGLVGALFLSVATADDSVSSEPQLTASSAPATLAQNLVYKPPSLGAPMRRIGGGTRGPGGSMLPLLAVLVPEHMGYTTQAQPMLYWYISDKSNKPVELVLLSTDPMSIGEPPLLVTQLTVEHSGYQMLNLAEFDVELQAGVEYEWFISVINNPARRSQDLIASGLIKRINASPVLQQRLDETPPALSPLIYADAGLWYDAFSALCQQINAQPEQADLRKARASLLQQVGLEKVLEIEEANIIP